MDSRCVILESLSCDGVEHASFVSTLNTTKVGGCIAIGVLLPRLPGWRKLASVNFKRASGVACKGGYFWMCTHPSSCMCARGAFGGGLCVCVCARAACNTAVASSKLELEVMCDDK